MFIGFKFRIVFGDGEDARGLLANALLLVKAFTVVVGGADGEVARLCDALKEFGLVLGVAFYGLYELGDQIPAFLELNVYAAEGALHRIAFVDETIVNRDPVDQGNEYYYDEDDEVWHVGGFVRVGVILWRRDGSCLGWHLRCGAHGYRCDNLIFHHLVGGSRGHSDG